MVQFRWLQMSSFLVLLPHFTGAEVQNFCVKTGNNAVMHCRNGIDHWGKCDNARWLFHRLLTEGEQELSRGWIITRPEDKSYRLSVTEECSLVIREVTFDDAGYYSCKNSHTYLQPIIELTVFARVTRPTSGNDAPSYLQARTDCSVVDYIMLVLRVAELVLITVITVLLIRAPGNQRAPDDDTVPHDGGRHESAANYENIGGPSASVSTNVN